MKAQIKQILAQKGYAPIFLSIDSTIRDLKQAQYTKSEIKETLNDFFNIGDDKINKYINSK